MKKIIDIIISYGIALGSISISIYIALKILVVGYIRFIEPNTYFLLFELGLLSFGLISMTIKAKNMIKRNLKKLE